MKVNIFESQSKLLEQKVSDGELDLVIDNYHIDENKFERKILMEEHLLLAVPMSFKVNQNAADYRLTSADIRNHVHLQPDFPGVPLKLFAEEPYITLRSPNDTRKRLEVIFQNIGVRPNIILKLDQLLTAYHLTEHGMGATLVSDTIIKSLPYDSDIAYYKLDDPNAVRNVYLYYRRSKYLTRSMAEFINLASHEPPAPLVVCRWPYWAKITFPPKGGLTNHCFVTGGRLKAALRYLLLFPSIRSFSYCSTIYFFIVSSFTLPTVSQ